MFTSNTDRSSPPSDAAWSLPGARARRSFDGQRGQRARSSLLLVLATLGVLDAAYLSYAHVAGAAVCGQSSGCDAVLEYAARAGLDAALLESCLDSGQGEAMVEADVAEGRDLGIRSTPSLFLNGHPFSVVPTREQLESRVAELNAAHGARRESSNDTGR